MIFFTSKTEDYCFVHIPKTAGTSFEKTIIKHSIDKPEYNLRFKNFMDYYGCKHGHTPFYFVNSVLVEKLKLSNDLKYISILRNPWDRLASLFEQEMLREKVGFSTNIQPKDIRNILDNGFDSYSQKIVEQLNLISSGNIKDLFKFWLFYLGTNRKVLPHLNPNFNITPQSWWIYDYIENNKVENIYLFEDLDEINEKFNIKMMHENKKPKKGKYSSYYNQETIDYVYRLDKFVIDTYGYDFDS